MLNLAMLRIIKPVITSCSDYKAKDETAAVKPSCKGSLDSVTWALAEYGAMSVSKLIEATGISQAALYRAVNTLKEYRGLFSR